MAHDSELRRWTTHSAHACLQSSDEIVCAFVNALHPSEHIHHRVLRGASPGAWVDNSLPTTTALSTRDSQELSAQPLVHRIIIIIRTTNTACPSVSPLPLPLRSVCVKGAGSVRARHTADGNLVVGGGECEPGAVRTLEAAGQSSRRRLWQAARVAGCGALPRPEPRMRVVCVPVAHTLARRLIRTGTCHRLVDARLLPRVFFAPDRAAPQQGEPPPVAATHVDLGDTRSHAKLRKRRQLCGECDCPASELCGRSQFVRRKVTLQAHPVDASPRRAPTRNRTHQRTCLDPAYQSPQPPPPAHVRLRAVFVEPQRGADVVALVVRAGEGGRTRRESQRDIVADVGVKGPLPQEGSTPRTARSSKSHRRVKADTKWSKSEPEQPCTRQRPRRQR
mmetsp:Transcript_24013/g.60742  ORF Transcript_24013/g.60742 Transcript_24013/m.60742 type:complete len:392 (+) Transcript_24013:77-1252(+)